MIKKIIFILAFISLITFVGIVDGGVAAGCHKTSEVVVTH